MTDLKSRLAAIALGVVLFNCSSEGPIEHHSSEDDVASVQQELSSSSNTKLTTGENHACAIYGGGKIRCWGNNTYGQLGNGTTIAQYSPVQVSGITNAVAVAAGEIHTCAVLADGTARCWGAGSLGKLGNGGTANSSVPVTVSGISTATAVGAGWNHACVLLSDSTVKCWGQNLYSQLGNGGSSGYTTTPVSVSGISTATGLASGRLHNCVRLSNSTLKCWGYNLYGELGDGTMTQRSTPVSVSGISTATAVAAGRTHTCARLSDSTVKCWGGNYNGQLGNNTWNDSATPVTVSGLSTAVGLGLGWSHSCARLSDGSLKCWGDNDTGQLGDGTTTEAWTPVTVTGVSGAAEVTGGTNFTCALLSSGDIKCWGENDFGQIGQGTGGYETVPLLIQGLTLNKVIGVATGRTHTCVLWDTGSVKCWGSNSYGQLGDGTTTSSSDPVDVSGISTAAAIEAGSFHTCARLADSTVKCWGANGRGQLGNGSYTASSTPVTVSGISTATAIAVGSAHSCARLSDSTVKCWGDNSYGELGNGSSTTQFNVPVTVSGISNATAIGAGGVNSAVNGSARYGEHSCAVLSTGGVKCWGKNNYGQLGNGTTSTEQLSPVVVSGLSDAVGVALGADFSCAVQSGGGVKCWGRNSSGQLGNGNTTNKNTPVTTSGITNATAVAAGATHACARLSDKSVKCWGYNDAGQLGRGNATSSSVPVTAVGLTRAVALDGGERHTCAMQDDGTLKCWGSNNSLQLGSGGKANHPSAVSLPCTAGEAERSDYFVGITTANMPDSALNGLSASIDVHRVKPVFFPESCPGASKALVMVHGRTVEAVTVFDLQYQTYSFQETLAKAGIDTFAMNHLGMGRSSGLGVMNNACNASLPAATGGQTCPPGAGALYDCYPPVGNVDPVNQQGSTRYLNPNPLSSLCAHTSQFRFTTSTTMGQDLDAVVNDALSKTGLSKVNLLGYSAGGIDVGNYLGDSNSTVRAAHTAKVERAIFVASLFGATGIVPPVFATEPGNVPRYPLGASDRGNVMAAFNVDLQACPGQQDPDIDDAIWASLMDRDSVGSTWGPPLDGEGLSRYPTASRWGWTTAAANRISVPTLVMNGKRDHVVAVAAAPALFDALIGTSSRAIMQIDCASHFLFQEGCTGTQCNGSKGPHETLAKNVKDWVLTGMIYASPGSTNGMFDVGGGDFTVSHTTTPTTTGPTVDESLNW